MSSVFHDEGVGYHETEIAEDLYAFSIDPQRALEEYLQLQIKIKPLYDLMFKNRIFTYFAAATPGPARAGHDRQGLGAGAARPAGEARRQVRPRDRRRSCHRPRDRDPAHAEDVRRHRPRGPDQAPGRRDLRLHHRPEPDLRVRGRMAGGDAGQRDARPAAQPAARSWACPRPDLHERPVSGAVLGRGGGHAARAARGSRRGTEPAACCGPRSRAALSEHRRATAQRDQLERLRAESGEDVLELPFLFRAAARHGGGRGAGGRDRSDSAAVPAPRTGAVEAGLR